MKPRAALIASVAGIVIYVAIVVGIYVVYLGPLTLSTTDPAPWGQFGDYIGGLLNPLFALLNVVVVAYIALSVQKIGESERKKEEESAERVQTVIQLHREWNSESIFRSRTLAGKLVRKFPTSTLLEIEDSVPYEDAVHVWIVIGFFQRLGFLVQHEKLHREMALELFAELFIWWWVISFERQLITCDWDARDRILKLKEWVYSNTTEEQRTPWLRRAKRDLDQAEENANTPPFFVV